MKTQGSNNWRKETLFVPFAPIYNAFYEFNIFSHTKSYKIDSITHIALPDYY